MLIADVSGLLLLGNFGLLFTLYWLANVGKSDCEPHAEEADPLELEHLHESIQPLALLLRGLLSHEAALVVIGRSNLSRCCCWRSASGTEWSTEHTLPGSDGWQYRTGVRMWQTERAEFGHPDVATMLTILTCRSCDALSSCRTGTTAKASRTATLMRPGPVP